jgi:RHS repeat-associated protein
MLGQVVVISNGPPEVAITSPAEGAVVGVGNIQVSGTFTDDGQVVSVRVNDVIATLNSGAYTATISLSSGSQVINVVAEDNLGLTGLVSRVVFVDGDGPQIDIHAPKDRQAVYTTTPTLTISYTDFYADVNPATFIALLTDPTGAAQNVTSDLVITATGAAGVLINPLAEDATYTLTVTLQDTFGNLATVTTRFYVPPVPETILPPEEPPQAGWVSGVVYDSTTCDEYQTTCQGLAGARVTIEKVDTEALTAMRSARQNQIMARLNVKASFAPLSPAAVTTVTLPVTGTVVTGPDGFFAFPADETAHYWLRVEKDGYTYGQREADIVREHSAATNAVYLTPIDSAVTPCDSGGCTHESSDGILQVEIPAGAIPSGEVVTTTATNFEQVEYLPSGELPPDTWETYAFNLGGDSVVTFTQPITVRIQNEIGFNPGAKIPLGYWNQATQAWEHAGTGVVDVSGTWVVMTVTHFSNYDCNSPVAPLQDANIGVHNEQQNPDTCPASSPACTVNLKSGTLREEYTLPAVDVLGQETAPMLLYNSNRVAPAAVIDVKLSMDVSLGIELGNYIDFELYIEGIKTDRLTFSSTLQSGEIGRYRYLWDGRDAQGNPLPPGVYDYAVKMSVPYRAQYCYSLNEIFGGPPDCENGATGVFVDATDDTWVRGTVELDAAPDSPFGAGWTLDGQQRLHEDEAGRILVTDGERADEFYFPHKDLLNGEETNSLSQSVTALPHPPTPSPEINPSTSLTPYPRSGGALGGMRISGEGEQPTPLSNRLPLSIGEGPGVRLLAPPEPAPDFQPPVMGNRLSYTEIQATTGLSVCGSIITNTVWTAANSPYQVTCDVGVSANVTLTIEAGVTVQFQHTGDDLIISGTLQAIGTELAPIYFRPLSGTIAGSWGRVAFVAGSGGVLDHTILEYGGSTSGLVYIASTAVQVLNSVVRYSTHTGIVIQAASPLISATQVLTNTNTSTFPEGGGVYNNSGSPTIQNNTFQGNSASGFFGYGSGVYNNSGNPTIQNNTFRGNSAGRLGGGVYNNSGSPTIQNNTFRGNSAGSDGGGVYNNSGSPTIQNNTFRGNSAGSLGGGVYNNSGSPTIRSNIIANSTGTGIYGSGGVPGPVLDYNDVWNNSKGNYSGVTPGAHDISADPLFVNAANGDFHLSPGSPCIEAGDPNHYPLTDFEGEPRPMGLIPDIGADEFRFSSPVSRTPTDHSAFTYDFPTRTYTRLYPDGTRVHFNLDGTHDYTLDSDGRKTAYTYNADGTLASMGIIVPSESTPRWTWTYHYTHGQLSSITDPAGRVTNFTIDEHNQLTAISGPEGAARHYAYDARGLLTDFTDEHGAVTSYTYDAYGRIHSVLEPPRAVYDPATRQTTVLRETRIFTPSDTGYALINDSPVGSSQNPAPPVPKSAALVDRVVKGRGELSGHTNEWGNWLDETDGEGRTTYYQRDAANNLTRQDNSDGTCSLYTYDSKGNRLSETKLDAAQCAATKALSGIQSLAGITQTWAYTYEDRFNQVKTETDPLGHTTTYFYDYELGLGEAGKIIRIVYPPVKNESGVMVTPTVNYTYTVMGLKAAETDARGAVTKYLYTQGTSDEAYGQPNARFAQGVTPVPGLLYQVILDFGRINETTTYRNFDAAGNPQTMIQPGGLTARYTYDAWNRVLTEENALGVVTQYEYDRRGNLLRKIQDYGAGQRNVTTTFTYNAHDQKTSEFTAADGLVVGADYVYDINRQLALQRDGLGHETLYRYDDADQLVSITNPAGDETAYTYTPHGQIETVTDPEGSVTAYGYDDFGHVLTQTVDAGGLNLTTRYAYDLNGNLLSTTDAAGAVACAVYDSHNRLVSATRDCGGLNLITTYAHDLNDNLIYVTDPRGVVTYAEYDALNRVTLTRQDASPLQAGGTEGGYLNLATHFTYDAAGNLAIVTDERGVVTAYTYDDLNQLTKSCQDASSSPLLAGGTEGGYLNLCTNSTYDTLGNRETVTDPAGVRTHTESNAFGRPVRTIEDETGLHAATQYEYDNALDPIRILDANGHATQYAYTPRDQVQIETYADGTTVGYTYDGRGNVLARTAQDGSTATSTYDGAGRLTGKTFSTGGSQSFGYDAAGRLVSGGQTLSGHTSQLTYAYNPLGDAISTTQTLDGQGWTVGYVYNYAGGVYTTTYPSGISRRYELDHLGRLDAVKQGGGALVADYAYLDLASYFTLTYPSGVETRSDYDALRRVTRVSSSVADYRYGYDAASNRTSTQRYQKAGHPADVYQYDGLYQLTQVWYGANATAPGSITAYDHLQRYDLDTLGNRLEVQNDGAPETYLPNDGDRLTDPMNRYEQVAADPFTYDPRGNTLSDGRNTYAYDALNRQVSVIGDQLSGIKDQSSAISVQDSETSNLQSPISNFQSPTSSPQSEYVYDALGRRIAKVVSGATTHYVYDTQYRILEERDGAGSLLARYTYGAGIDEPLTMERGGNTYDYLRDALGSVTEMTNAAGALVERYEYDVYGQPSIFDAAGNPLTASAIGNPYLFTARQYDPESGNYDYRARTYSPWVGRFLQMDPSGYVDGMGLYAYVGNSSASRTDPLGLNDCKCNQTFIQADYSDIPGEGKCYGASGSQCAGDPLHKPKYHPESATVEVFVTEGSKAHDACCVNNPNGRVCRGWNIGEQFWRSGLCSKEWDKAVVDASNDRGHWQTFGPYWGKYSCGQTWRRAGPK